ncbi:hypothetical protein CW304_18065 [Bacillus sp. UFRGS-B20]|nr:hypothetical protein CW304_18065 [Bacillus sp. UFRGS-B20]
MIIDDFFIEGAVMDSRVQAVDKGIEVACHESRAFKDGQKLELPHRGRQNYRLFPLDEASNHYSQQE